VLQGMVLIEPHLVEQLKRKEKRLRIWCRRDCKQ